MASRIAILEAERDLGESDPSPTKRSDAP